MNRSGILLLTLAVAGGPAVADTTANAGITNNYLWRGLTQSVNQAAVSGGLDWSADSGFYIGTWASNVEYAPGDTYKRVFAIDIEVCRRCGGKLKVIASIEDPPVIERILAHLGGASESADAADPRQAKRRRCQSRAPPQGDLLI